MGSYSPAPPPEVLPPEMSRQAPPRRRRSRWAVAPATYVLIAINCVWFLYMTMRGVSFTNPTGDQLMLFGADNAGSVLLHGEWYRIFTAMFVHAGILHLSVNMWCLWNLGLLAEPLMGSTGVIAVYVLTGTAGNLLSNFVNWYRFHAQGVFPACVGASGAVFGIAGALIILLKSKQLPVPTADLHKLRRSVIYFAGINLAIGFAASLTSGLTGIDIDNMAHLGGVSCGLLFAMPMVPRLGSSRTDFQARLRLSMGIVVGILILFTFYIHTVVR